jgi:hypothetical protein
MKNMPKTRTSAQRYNARMDKLFNNCIETKKKHSKQTMFNAIQLLNEIQKNLEYEYGHVNPEIERAISELEIYVKG